MEVDTGCCLLEYVCDCKRSELVRVRENMLIGLSREPGCGSLVMLAVGLGNTFACAHLKLINMCGIP